MEGAAVVERDGIKPHRQFNPQAQNMTEGGTGLSERESQQLPRGRGGGAGSSAVDGRNGRREEMAQEFTRHTNRGHREQWEKSHTEKWLESEVLPGEPGGQ